MRCAGRADQLNRLHPQLPDAGEQPLAGTEQDRRDVHVQLVDQGNAQILVDRVGTAGDLDVLAARCFLRALVCRFDARSDDVERRATALGTG